MTKRDAALAHLCQLKEINENPKTKGCKLLQRSPGLPLLVFGSKRVGSAEGAYVLRQ